jgi:hypothetical protein
MEVPLVLCMAELEGILVILLGIMYFICMQRYVIFLRVVIHTNTCYPNLPIFSVVKTMHYSPCRQAGREVLVDCDSCREGTYC